MNGDTDISSEPGGSAWRRRIVPEVAYLLPMLLFLAFTFVGGHWDALYPASYVAKTVLVALVIMVCWPAYTRITWNGWWLGILVGIVGVVQWIGMERLLPAYPQMDHAIFNPFTHFANRQAAWAFIAVRLAGAVLLVPVMEELFWRDFLWRSIVAPNDFRLAKVGEWDWTAFLIVAVAFGAGVHIEWITAIVYGLMIGGLLLYTRSLGACILAHATTNLLLGLYVLETGRWQFW